MQISHGKRQPETIKKSFVIIMQQLMACGTFYFISWPPVSKTEKTARMRTHTRDIPKKKLIGNSTNKFVSWRIVYQRWRTFNAWLSEASSYNLKKAFKANFALASIAKVFELQHIQIYIIGRSPLKSRVFCIWVPFPKCSISL